MDKKTSPPTITRGIAVDRKKRVITPSVDRSIESKSLPRSRLAGNLRRRRPFGPPHPSKPLLVCVRWNYSIDKLRWLYRGRRRARFWSLLLSALSTESVWRQSWEWRRRNRATERALFFAFLCNPRAARHPLRTLRRNRGWRRLRLYERPPIQRNNLFDRHPQINIDFV